ncbi:ABC transporter substrate-binding protein [Paenibacillus fonticola]|uniref:ABC transporter substrate-binding protein n=1 Tax=Paenibacillus fonticola TaxID=379896 RepID=UPI000363C739|nr:sugar ABC transporter substrate-binding protein [Paenibacillus fonticola]
MKKITLILSALIIILGGLAGCANKDGGSETKSASSLSANEKVKLTYFSWDPSQEEALGEMIQKFQQENPNIEVSMQSYKPADYWTKISAMAASGEMPDVFDMSSGYIDEWASKGLLANLQTWIDRDIKQDDYFTSIFDAVRYPDKEKGDMYAFPYAWVTTVLYYNKDMFDQANLSYPTEEWTWEEFRNAAKKLTIDTNGDGTTDQWGFWFFGRYAQIEPWLYQNNGDILNPEKSQFEINKNGKETLKFLTDLTTADKVSPAPKDMKGIKQEDIFAMGKAAMWVDGSFMIDNNPNVIGDNFKWGMTSVPRGPHYKDQVTYGWPDNLAISSTSKHTEEAWKFIQFMTGESRGVEHYQGGKVPIYKPVALSEEWLEADMQPANKDFILEQGNYVGRNSYTIAWSEWRGYGAAEGSGLNGELDQVLDGIKSLDDAIASVTKYANETLNYAFEVLNRTK